ncbi:carbohydrate ABC transporter permease [Paenarthrobacter sp. AR 02]|uniref:Binding-protein-dependent transport systems inner membrane component n=1 Tax=Pseudarthrobacter chlorophenolicus (strain ATCC 700700 / DSM 12829 / CIP 107037 / JCM 12360 / KCTC 9906 / NCIMB 13794 / A6) TaxID=452863 RepID=B8HJG7_PSECP|nr:MULTISPECIES: carbohydrate ABC transporter permease [Micrococcaceae]ACL42565.1 binding-protein-dependent transport systems inner membrane component [Pseudarthrobacter chlorophenolicus A6]MCF3140866.1 carbohydrate ABC transporter permease [Paenarthrobacter sp. AR 02]QQQ64308.1 carbohydrate ABC transporter permease [Paenarthrobacter ureafaciens]SDQ09063.1 carbohydrate ABC transporter membrane protein 2, CUT1 family [Pseudarthrobacter chlorophenolicus]
MSTTQTRQTTVNLTPNPQRTRAQGRTPSEWVLLAVAVIAGAAIFAPFGLIILNAFKSTQDYSSHGPLSWPTSLSIDAFINYLGRVNFGQAFWNSLIISLFVAAIAVVLSLMSAYPLGIGRVKANGSVLAVLLVATMLPHEALIYPLFYGAQATGTFNTVWSVIIVFSVLQAAYGTYLLASVMGAIPKELIEAAQLDGATRWQILWRILVPILRPSLAVLVVFFFIWTWNEFYIPVVLLSDQSSQTVPIALATLRGQHNIDITVLNAGSLLSLLPTLVFFLLFQRTLVRGVAAGAVK